MKRDELCQKIWNLGSDITGLEKSYFAIGRTPPERPKFSVNAWDEHSVTMTDSLELQDAVPQLESHVASLRVGLRLKTPLSGVAGSEPKFKGLDEIASESAELRQRLESAQPGCTASIPTLGKKATLDEILEESKSLKAVNSGTTARHSTATAQPSPTAAAQPSAPPLENLAIDRAAFGRAIASGKISAAALSQHGEIARLKEVLKGQKPGSLSAKSVAAKIANLEKTMPPMFPKK